MRHIDRSSLLRDAGKGLGGQIFVAALLAAVTATSTVGLAASAAWLIARSAERPGVLTLTFVMGIVQLFALAKAAARYGERLATHNVALSMMARVRSRVARQLLPLLPGGLGRNEAGTVDVIIGDVSDVEDLLVAVIAPLAAALVSALVSITIAGWIAWWSAVVLCGGLVVVGLVLPVLATKIGAAPDASLIAARDTVATLFSTTATSAAEFGLAGASGDLHSKLALLDDTMDRAMRQRAFGGGVIAAVSLVCTGATVGAALFVSVHALAHGAINRSVIAVVPLAAMAALEVAAGVAPAMLSLRRDRAALERLSAIGALVPKVTEPERAGPDVALATSVVASDLAVGYGERVIVRGANLSLAPATTTVIEGPSGSGKTTIALALAKLLDVEAGTVQLGNVPFDVLRGSQVRARVGIMTGEPHLFATTLAANLRVGAPGATDEELHEACRHVGLDDLVNSLPDGLSTKLAEATNGISGGERRRVGLARELLAARPIVLLDEPTASLDEPTARRALEGFFGDNRSRAVLVISHDPVVRSIVGTHLCVRDGVAELVVSD